VACVVAGGAAPPNCAAAYVAQAITSNAAMIAARPTTRVPVLLMARLPLLTIAVEFKLLSAVQHRSFWFFCQTLRNSGLLNIEPEFRSCKALWEETPHPARYSRHPLPKGEGGNQSTLTALSLGERVARSRRIHQPCGTGEGLLPKIPSTRSVLEVIKAGNSDSAGGAYVPTLVVGMYAPHRRAQTCQRAARLCHPRKRQIQPSPYPQI